MLTFKINLFLTRFFGIQIHKTRGHFNDARMHVIKSGAVEVVLDGGANEGQWAKRLLAQGYSGLILSVEPGKSAFKKLLLNTKKIGEKPSSWKAINVGLGMGNYNSELYLAGNSGQSSSFKKPELHLTQYPTVVFAGSEMHEIKTIHEVICDYEYPIYLKLDIQGMELEALQGIGKSVNKIYAIEIELTVLPMYSNEAKLGQVISKLEALNFSIFSISEFGKKNNGQVTYFDIIAVKNENINLINV